MGDEAGIMQPGGHLCEHLGGWWGAPNVMPTDAVKLGGADAVPPSEPGCDETAVAIEHRPGAVDHDHADLQHMVAAQ
ncbi:MAG: hypothetical protein WCK21_05570 [Actinomycetota bacterium]